MSQLATAFPLRVGQVGHFFRLQFTQPDGTVIPVDAASPIQLKFRDPEDPDNLITVTASFSTGSGHAGDGTDGWVQYRDTDGTLCDELGRWKYWGRAVVAGSEWLTSTLVYDVVAEGAE
jgi:hypothetical protein